MSESLEINSTDRITLCGLPGTGKTTLGKYLAALAEPDVYIYDPLDQYSGFGSDIRYIPQTDSQQEFERICRKMCSISDRVFIVEEAERYLRQGRYLGPYSFDVINRGRNWGVGIYAITRRIQLLSKDFFDLCKHVFIFKCGLRSRSYIGDMIGNHAIEVMETLPPYHFIHYNLETDRWRIATLKLAGGKGKVIAMGEEQNVRQDKIIPVPVLRDIKGAGIQKPIGVLNTKPPIREINKQ